jgi:hypothetical protein
VTNVTEPDPQEGVEEDDPLPPPEPQPAEDDPVVEPDVHEQDQTRPAGEEASGDE